MRSKPPGVTVLTRSTAYPGWVCNEKSQSTLRGLGGGNPSLFLVCAEVGDRVEIAEADLGVAGDAAAGVGAGAVAGAGDGVEGLRVDGPDAAVPHAHQEPVALE